MPATGSCKDANVLEAELSIDVEDIFTRWLKDVEERKIIAMEKGLPAPRNVTLKSMSAATLHNSLVIASRELADKIIERVLKGVR